MDDPINILSFGNFINVSIIFFSLMLYVLVFFNYYIY